MTLENSERLLAHYDSCRKNPELDEFLRAKAEENYKDMLKNLQGRGWTPPAVEKSKGAK